MTPIISTFTSEAVFKAVTSFARLIKVANTCAQAEALIRACDKTTHICLNEADRLIRLADKISGLSYEEYNRIENQVIELHNTVDKITQQTHFKATQILRRTR
jgi:hypothetical protein